LIALGARLVVVRASERGSTWGFGSRTSVQGGIVGAVLELLSWFDLELDLVLLDLHAVERMVIFWAVSGSLFCLVSRRSSGPWRSSRP
jgi:hypothetical protein